MANVDDASLYVLSVLRFGSKIGFFDKKKKGALSMLYIGNAEYVFAIWD